MYSVHLLHTADIDIQIAISQQSTKPSVIQARIAISPIIVVVLVHGQLTF